jgi:hypothetical protein
MLATKQRIRLSLRYCRRFLFFY